MFFKEQKEMFEMAEYQSVSINSQIIETVIGAKTKFKGSVSTDKPIKIDGYFEGKIETTASVVISETGEVNGTIRCADFNLMGKGKGNAIYTNLCQIAPGGYFEGDITTADLITVKGSVINGKIIISK